MKKLVLASLLALAAVAVARPPINVDPRRHPNLAAAQRLSGEAFDKVEAAQAANEWDMGGHARRAKELLEQAGVELKLAAETANAR